MEEINKYRSAIDYIRNLDLKNNQSTVALEYYGNKIVRSEYWKYVNKYRNYFTSLGIGIGDPVAICMLNSPEYEFIFSALLENGSIASTVSKSFLNADIKRQTIERNIKTLILSVEFLPDIIENKTFEQFDGFPNLQRIVFTTIGDFMPEKLEKKYNSRDFRALIKALNLPNNIQIVYPGEMKECVEKISCLSLPSYNLLDQVATYSNTGGTTGAPKCAFHTHRAISSLIKSHDKKVFHEFNLKQNSRSLLVIPISHITSQFYALLLRRASGANIIYNPNVFEASVLREELIKENIDDVVLPFGLYYAITRSPIEYGSLKLNTPACGGEPTPYAPTVEVNKILNSCGSESIIIGTGSTEFGSGIMGTYGINGRSNESGYFFPYASGFILDPYSGDKITQPGKKGILYANAPWQMEGYLNDEKATNDFFNYTDLDGKIYGTNNDIVEIVDEHNGQPVYSMLGRASDFVLQTTDKKYFPGITYTNGRVNKVNFEEGNFLFDMRDVLLNIEGVMEAQPVIIPFSDNKKEGYPVVNIVINPNFKPYDILKKAYEIFKENNKFMPKGIIFRTKFERSLSSDKREVISLIEDRYGYYFYEDGKVYSVSLPKNAAPQIEEIDDIKIYEPPTPKLVYSNRKKAKK